MNLSRALLAHKIETEPRSWVTNQDHTIEEIRAWKKKEYKRESLLNKKTSKKAVIDGVVIDDLDDEGWLMT